MLKNVGIGITNIISLFICVEDAAASDIREVIVEDEGKNRAKQTSLGNSLVSNILRITQLGLHYHNLSSML